MIYANSPNKIEKIKIVIQMLSPMNGVQKVRNFIVMAESARGQDKANPVLLLTPPSHSCSLGISRVGPVRKMFSFWP